MILAPTYSPERSLTGATPYRGVMLDVRDAMPWIEAATVRLVHNIYGNPSGRSSSIDDRTLIQSTEQFVNGYKGEAAFAMHYGLHIDHLLSDAPGRADFEFRGRNVDVKTVFTMEATHVSVRADTLGKDLSKWWIVGAKSTLGSTHVTLVGFLPGRDLLKYTPRAAAHGHDKSYVRVPMDDLLAMPEVHP